MRHIESMQHIEHVYEHKNKKQKEAKHVFKILLSWINKESKSTILHYKHQERDVRSTYPNQPQG